MAPVQTMVDKATLDGLRIERPHGETRRRSPLVIALPFALILIALVAWGVTRNGAAEVKVAPARAIASGSGGGAVLNASGYVTARRRATVSSKVTGKVTEVYVEEGMQVKAGQVLARLDEAYASRAL